MNRDKLISDIKKSAVHSNGYSSAALEDVKDAIQETVDEAWNIGMADGLLSTNIEITPNGVGFVLYHEAFGDAVRTSLTEIELQAYVDIDGENHAIELGYTKGGEKDRMVKTVEMKITCDDGAVFNRTIHCDHGGAVERTSSGDPAPKVIP